ncbi:MAG: AAA family ATPase, partial [Candidatus Omnitrophota bacterium]
EIPSVMCRIVAKNGRELTICNHCMLEIGKHMGLSAESEIPVKKEADGRRKPGKSKVKITSPQDIYSELKRHIIGQESYLRTLACFGYNLLRRTALLAGGAPRDKIPPKENLFLIGPTGSGKTAGILQLCNILEIPHVITDVTGLTEAGYVGGDVEDILRIFATSVGNDVDAFAKQCSLIFLDEIDKLSARLSSSNSKDVSGEGVQQALLKLLSGDSQIDISGRRWSSRDENRMIRTHNIHFVAAGAFSGLRKIVGDRRKENAIGFRALQSPADREEIAYNLGRNEVLIDDLHKYGMLPELVGRFSRFEVLHPLSVDELKRVLVEPEGSILKKQILRFENEGIALSINDSALEVIARKAYETKLGARGLQRILDDYLYDLQFEHFGRTGVRQITVYSDDAGEIKTHVKKRKKAGASGGSK